MKITVFGSGAYGISIALMLAKKKNNKIVICSHDESSSSYFKEKGRFINYPDLKVPENISLISDYELAMEDVDVIFLVPAVKYIRNICNTIKPYYKGSPVCIASKGIETEHLQFSSVLVKTILNTNNVANISGPTFAEDLMNNEPAALAIAGYNNKAVDTIISVLANDTLKLRKSSDIIGIQLCGSVKNIIAIASGMIRGLGYSNSTEAFLINESLHDMKKIIHSLGGKRKTILSFAGVGDLLLTCTSTKSRNYSFGFVIGSTKDKDKIKEYLDNNTVEGFYTLKSIKSMLEKKGISIPLINLIYEIVCEDKKPEELIEFLVTKD